MRMSKLEQLRRFVGRCGRCGGTLFRDDDGARCLMCARPPESRAWEKPKADHPGRESDYYALSPLDRLILAGLVEEDVAV
jgi:hypothetical protein